VNTQPAADRILRARRVVTPEGMRPACVRVRDGRIVALEAWDAPVSVTDELGELALLPGLVDTHVHVDEPGRADWEGFRTATQAAAAGGITTLVDMPLNSVPATIDAPAVRSKVFAMRGKLQVDVALWGGVVPDNLPDLGHLAQEGVSGFKCFLCPSGVDEFGHVGVAALRPAMNALARLGLPLLVHAEDPARLRPLTGPTRRYADWLASRPAEAEASAIRMLGLLACDTGTSVHVVHVSSAAGLDAIATARAAGAEMTAETCPHYLTFDAAAIPEGGTVFKCAPPIRGAGERDALVRALLEGRLDMVASDHSPAPPALKDIEGGDFEQAWGGIASLECSLAATWTALRPHGARLEDLARWLGAAPARLAGLTGRKGAIAPGCDADLVAFDPDDTWTVDAGRLHQRHPVTPYAGMTLSGRVRATWLRGLIVFNGRELRGEPLGRWLRRGAEPVDPARAFA